MTARHASYDHRVRFLLAKTIAYIESRDEINCRDHGPTPYDLFYLGDNWHKVCHRCVSMVLPDAKDAVPITKSSALVCEHPGCDNDALKNNYCCWCKALFCIAHMADTFLCITCDEELDNTKEVKDDPRAAFHAC